MKDQIKVNTLPQIDREGLLAFDLPKPIESYITTQKKYKIPKENGKKKYKFVCSICTLTIRTEVLLKKHLQKYHEPKYVCPIENCGDYFDTKKWYNFIRHMYDHSLVKGANVR